jgi:hypothetical protein
MRQLRHGEINELQMESESHDQADAEWIVIRTQLRGHNDTPFGRPTPSRPVLILAAQRAYLVILVIINLYYYF